MACNGPLVFCRMRSRLRETTHFVKKCVPSRSKHMFLNWWWRDPGPYHLSSNRLKSDFLFRRQGPGDNSQASSDRPLCLHPCGSIWPERSGMPSGSRPGWGRKSCTPTNETQPYIYIYFKPSAHAAHPDLCVVECLFVGTHTLFWVRINGCCFRVFGAE